MTLKRAYSRSGRYVLVNPGLIDQEMVPSMNFSCRDCHRGNCSQVGQSWTIIALHEVKKGQYFFLHILGLFVMLNSSHYLTLNSKGPSLNSCYSHFTYLPSLHVSQCARLQILYKHTNTTHKTHCNQCKHIGQVYFWKMGVTDFVLYP